MGNGTSCVVPAATRTTSIISPEGEVRRVEIPVGVAELMIEAPGHVVAHATDLVQTRRVFGMRADEELRAGEIYLLLPVEWVGSRICDRQLAVVLTATGEKKTNRKKKVSGRQVVPIIADEDKEGKRGEEKLDLGFDANKVMTGLAGKRVGGCGQWRPKLDTIRE